jgi:hypothetical protein
VNNSYYKCLKGLAHIDAGIARELKTKFRSWGWMQYLKPVTVITWKTRIRRTVI